MSTPRTVKASEVVKGMRVRWEIQHEGATITTEGEATLTSGTRYASEIVLGDYRAFLDPDHPVTVLADPEPEWVEGAWYWVDFVSGVGRRPMFRDNGLWSVFVGGSGMRYEDDEVTVLGRVLIVDWPGDDVARRLLDAYPGGEDLAVTIDVAGQLTADAIRTQGGAR